jgi:hypothetical protein
MAFKGYRELSKTNWGHEGENATLEQINTGAILRIADATEKMAQRHTELIRERDNLEGNSRRWQARAEESAKRIAALKGVITKLKKKQDKTSE